jgi:hypothetical protein
MNLSAPTVPVFWIAVVLAVIAVLGHFAIVPIGVIYSFWLAIIAFIILVGGCVMKGL